MILLAELLGRDLDTDELEDLAHRAMLNAALAGRAAAREEEAEGAG